MRVLSSAVALLSAGCCLLTASTTDARPARLQSLAAATASPVAAVSTYNLSIYANPTAFGLTSSKNDSSDIWSEWAIGAGLPPSSVIVSRAASQQLIATAANFSALGYTHRPDLVLSFTASQSAYAADIFVNMTWPPPGVTLRSELELLSNYSDTYPYQLNVISLIYDPAKHPTYNTTFAAGKDFTLENLFTTDTVSELSCSNPLIDSNGLAALMWSVSEYGDPTYNITGSNSKYGDWRYFWQRALAQNMTIYSSWDNAFATYEDPTSSNGFMVSYGADPAYNVCQNFTNNINTFVSSINGTKRGWAEIIEVGVVAGSAHQQAATDFANWLISNSSAQQKVIEQNWSVPGDAAIPLPDCYYTSGSVLPSQVQLYNSQLLSQVNLRKALPVWLQQWNAIYQAHLNGTQYQGYIYKGNATSVV